MGQVSRRNVILVLGAGILVGVGLGFLILFGLENYIPIQTLSDQLADTDGPRVGNPAPDFTLTNLAGEEIRLEDLEGKPVLINFWATWCGPCVLEMPNIQKYYEQFNGQFEVLAINADEPEFEVRQFSEDIGISFDVLLDPGAKIQELYRLRGYPTSYFLDGEGIVRVNHIGMLTEAQIEEYLKEVGVSH